MKRKAILSAVLTGIVAVAVIVSVFIFGNSSEYISEIDENKVNAAYNLLNNSLRTKEVRYIDFRAANSSSYVTSEYQAGPNSGINDKDYEGTAVTLNYSQQAEYSVEVDEPGLYYLALDF